MLICVVGNISSGKSTTCKALEKILKDYTYISLDEYRKEYNKSKSLEGEEKAQNEFIKKMCTFENVIIEATGTGKPFAKYLTEYKRKYKADSVFIVTLECSIEKCIERTEEKFNSGYQWPPLPDVWKDWFNTRHLDQMTVLKNSIKWMNDKIPMGNLKIKTEDLTPQQIADKIAKYIK